MNLEPKVRDSKSSNLWWQSQIWDSNNSIMVITSFMVSTIQCSWFKSHFSGSSSPSIYLKKLFKLFEP